METEQKETATSHAFGIVGQSKIIVDKLEELEEPAKELFFHAIGFAKKAFANITAVDDLQRRVKELEAEKKRARVN